MSSQTSIPLSLLAAVSVAESSKNIHQPPHPWAVGTAEKGYYPKSKEEAIALVTTLQKQGISNIDVGCMQVNLRYHPKAFENLEDAFDPLQNTTYGAAFLQTLKERLGTWDKAVAHYHSKNASVHKPYKDKVLRLWYAMLNRPWVQKLKKKLQNKFLMPHKRVFALHEPITLPKGLMLSEKEYRTQKEKEGKRWLLSQQVPKHFIQ